MTLDSILLLSCRSPFLDDSKIYAPMANLYLKSFVNKHLPHVNIVLGDDDYTLQDLSWAEPFKAIGISIMTPQREEALKILKAVKTRWPEKVVIAGGPHCKHYTAEVETEPYDYIVPLDGERALVQILSGNAIGRTIRDVMQKQDILEQPRPDRTSDNARSVIKRYHYTLQGREATTMMTARGCCMPCTFCEDRLTVVKWSSLENLCAEMEDVKSLGYTATYIFDDLFAIAMPKVRPICDELAKRDLWYRCNGQANFFVKWGEDFAKMLADTGCKEIAFGHESGSQTILDAVEKRTTVEQNYESVEYAKKHGIKVKSFLMIGLPGETLGTIAETEKFMMTSGVDDAQLAVFYPYKGTKIRDDIDRGNNEVDLMFMQEGLGAYGQKGGNTEAVVRTTALSAEDLLRERDRLVRLFKPQAHEKKWKDEDKFFDTPKVNV